MSEVMNRVQLHIKKRSNDFGTYIFRVMTGGWMGLIFAHLFQRVFEFENLLFLFVIVLTTGVIVKVTKGWKFLSVILFNLFCILVCVLLQMYIRVASGV